VWVEEVSGFMGTAGTTAEEVVVSRDSVASGSKEASIMTDGSALVVTVAA
jgi:hypothetical protein